MKFRFPTRPALRAALCCAAVCSGVAGQAQPDAVAASDDRVPVPATAQQPLVQVGVATAAGVIAPSGEDHRSVPPAHRPWAVLLAIGAGALSAWALARVGRPGGARDPRDTFHRGDRRGPGGPSG